MKEMAMASAHPVPLQIVFHQIDKSEALESTIREQVDKLQKFHPAIQSCRVVVEKQHKHHHQGNHFHVGIHLQVTGHSLDTEQAPAQNKEQADVNAALKNAFKAMRRQLEDWARHQQRHVKHHTEKPQGHIIEIAPDKTFGRIESTEGRWLYFHRNSLAGADLDQLQVGTPVYYVEDMGEEGPQASSVHPIGKHHILI
jgi:ribosomal subunit interface protein